jgi:beta-xylosidase
MANAFAHSRIIFILLFFLSGPSVCVPAGFDSTGRGESSYSNPIIPFDFSDPDVIRVGDVFYMTASSFNCVPGLPVLRSVDLVHWTIIGYALQRLTPVEVFDRPQHGKGVWAPAIRFHEGRFMIYYGDPDYGIFVVTATDPAGPWDPPVLVKEAKGWIDPAPFWDGDGSAYLVHAFAGSRAGIKSVLVLHRMNREGTALMDDGVIVYDGHERQPTIEGPKLYRHDGRYYIFAPAGGVTKGWQTVLRSDSLRGPYEERIVMDAGTSGINGPHQGAWVLLESGESWFLHFQDRGAYGRIVHLQPMIWRDGWPVIGSDPDGDGKGEPVSTWNIPDAGRDGNHDAIQMSDEFNGNQPGLQWQWEANPRPEWAMPFPSLGSLRMYAVPDSGRNLRDFPNLLLQKIPARPCTITTRLICRFRSDGEGTGLVVMGTDYAMAFLRRSGDGLVLEQRLCLHADRGSPEVVTKSIPLEHAALYLRLSIVEDARCSWSYSLDGRTFVSFGEIFTARPGKWIGAKVGFVCVGTGTSPDRGSVDIDWFRYEDSLK